MRDRSLNGCEWNPDAGKPSYGDDDHHVTTPATVCVGRDGLWHLCALCAELPQFKRFKKIPLGRPISKVDG